MFRLKIVICYNIGEFRMRFEKSFFAKTILKHSSSFQISLYNNSLKQKRGHTEELLCTTINKDLIHIIIRKQQTRTFHRLVKGSGLNALVPVAGLEPARCRQRWILSPLRLPFHHTGRCYLSIVHFFEKCKQKFMRLPQCLRIVKDSLRDS